MKTCSTVIAACVLMALMRTSHAENPAPAFSPQTVILDRFEARDARLSDAVEALTILAEKATHNAWHPTLVLLGDGLGERKITLSLDKPAFSTVLDRLAKGANLDIIYGKNSVALSAKKG